MDWRTAALALVAATWFAGANVLTKQSLAPGQGHRMAWVSLLAIGAFFGFRSACQACGLGVTSAVVDSLVTLGTVGWAVFVLREDLTKAQCVGLALILAGLTLVHGSSAGSRAAAAAPAPAPDAKATPK